MTRAVHFYTDGSHQAEQKQDSWATVEIHQDQGGFAYQGYHAGNTLHTTTTLSTGDRLDSTASEMVALAITYLRILTLRQRWTYTITADNTTAIQIAKGECTHKRFEKLSLVLRALAQEAHYFYDIELRHTRSHRGDPWNEMADSIAKHFTTHPAPITSDFVKLALAHKEHISWAWLHYDTGRAAAYPPLNSRRFHYDAAMPMATTENQPPQAEQHKTETKAIQIQLGAASYNARS